ncbi:hypothetical protein Tco_0803215 [Tanacetum coccineum]|uniref:Uncharacterized protein n=1 Tax=Tanacetum coccineum TaxID=301880 RepID=A0ABQ5A4L6_9ASTR
MSDSEDSTIAYTEVSSPFEDLSDIGSPGVIVHGYDGLPMMPEDPYAYVEAALQAPPSPDYVPGPEEPEQAPPPPDFILEPVYPKFMPPEDDSDPEADPEEEDDEDLTEDPTDYPTDRDDDDEEEESFEDDSDDEEEDEHPALTDSVPPPSVERLLALTTPPPSELTPLSSPLPQIPSPPLPISPSPLYASPTHFLGYRPAMIRLRAESHPTSHPLPLPPPIILPCTRAFMAMMRAAAPSTYCLAPQLMTPPPGAPPSGTPPLLPIPLPTSSPPFLLPSTNRKANGPEVLLPPRKRLCIAHGPRYEIGESSSALTAKHTGGFKRDYGFFATLDAEIRRDLDREIGYGITNRQSMDASDTTRSEVMALRTTVLAQKTEIGELRAADCRRQTQLTVALTLIRTLQTQMAALQRQQRPARDPSHPDVPEEAGSSS